MVSRGSAYRCGGGGQPAFRPVGYRAQHRFERATTRCQSIAHAHGGTWVDQAFNDAFCLELAKTLGEDSIADPRDAGEQLIETRGCRKQRSNDRSGPPLSNQLDSALKGRAVADAPSDHGE